MEIIMMFEFHNKQSVDVFRYDWGGNDSSELASRQQITPYGCCCCCCGGEPPLLLRYGFPCVQMNACCIWRQVVGRCLHDVILLISLVACFGRSVTRKCTNLEVWNNRQRTKTQTGTVLLYYRCCSLSGYPNNLQTHVTARCAQIAAVGVIIGETRLSAESCMSAACPPPRRHSPTCMLYSTPFRLEFGIARFVCVRIHKYHEGVLPCTPSAVYGLFSSLLSCYLHRVPHNSLAVSEYVASFWQYQKAALEHLRIDYFVIPRGGHP